MFHLTLTRMGLSLALTGAMVLGSASCQQGVSPNLMHPTTQPFTKLDHEKLHNGHRVTERVYSGAQPEDEAAFAELQRLGVKTIISVDGAAPDAAMAKKYGIRYVHLPIGYDTVPNDTGLAIAKAMTELPGPFYVHCHHGRHRSAAAVAVACVMTNQIAPDRAEEVLKTFGTGANYTGLWASAREARPLPPEQIRAVQVVYVEKAKVPPLAEAMVHVDERTEHLKAVQAAGWKVPPNHPDINPPHEALQLQEMLVELGRSDGVQQKPQQFRDLMAASATAVGNLRTALMAQPIDPAAAETAMRAMTASCTACHREYRD
jgi:protein tyrosine phosphatase (PTP) superfamily phosphohydrolase (DUF442 family)